MSMLVAVTAFAMALGALWFTGEVAKRADARGKALVKPHLANFSAALGRAEQQIRDLSRALEKAEAEIKELKAINEANKAYHDSRDALEMIMKPAGSPKKPAESDQDHRFRPTGT